MSFLVTAALALSLLVALPAIAHLLRRGRARAVPFPPAGLVPPARTLARRERRLEDKLLFAVRALAVLALAVLGATPFVQCSRLSLARGAGGSLAVAVVLDDSLSMRGELAPGQSRFARAREAARDLLASTREGDSVSIVLAGKPARVVLGATTDLGLARRVLEGLSPSDRATDLVEAVALARASLADGGGRQRRVVLLSDHAAPPPASGTPPVWTPLPELARPVPDCGIVSAERRGARIVASVACNRPEAARGRRLEIAPAAGSGIEPSDKPRSTGNARSSGGEALAKAPLDVRAGVQTVAVDVTSKERLLAARLDGADALAHDDLAPVSPDDSALGVGIVVDAASSRVVTGGPTPLEQALGALEAGIALRPLGVLPDAPNELEPFALVVLDDPRGIGPEARAALTAFVEGGGVALGLLGPRVESTELGATLEPFVFGAARWEKAPKATGANVASLGWLGPEAASMDELALLGRVGLDAGRLRDARVIAEFSDGAPFIIERPLGRGAVFTVTLPSTPAESDFALRPGFLALLDHFVNEAKRRRGARRTAVGASWEFGAARPTVHGPEGPLELLDSSNRGRVLQPPLRGIYRVIEPGHEELRTATLSPEEILAEPKAPPADKLAEAAPERERGVDVSSEFGLLLIALLACELALRVARLVRARRFRTA